MFRILGVLVVAATLAQGGLNSFRQQVNTLLANKNCAGGAFSIKIIDAKTGDVVYQRDAETALIPASNMKVVTTAAAIKRLGFDYSFPTHFGWLDNNLVVIGSGDPLLGDPVYAAGQGQTIETVFEQLAQAMKEKGHWAIEGDLLLDDTIFDDVRFHPSWPADQANNWYVAQVSGLNYNDNCLDICLRPTSQAGTPALVSITPDTHYVQLINRTKTVLTGNSTGWASRSRGGNEIVLRGNVKVEQLFNVTIDRPAAFLGMALAEYLSKHGIAIRGKLVVLRVRDDLGGIPAEMETLLVHQTPLEAVVRRANQRSLNLAAECLLKRIGAEWSQQRQAPGRGTWENGIESAADFLKSLGCPESGYLLDDGSGLSHNNRLSAAVLVSVLQYVYQNDFFERFLTTMAKPGAGTLQKRFGHFDSDRLFAKTGYVNGAWALSGFYQRSNENWIIFSMIANRKAGGSLRSVIDNIVTAFSTLDEP